MTNEPAVFALHATQEFGAQVAQHLGVALSAHEEREFDDGEHKARPLASVRGRDVYAIQSLHGDDRQSVNDKLCRLLFFLGALHDVGAAQVTAVVPYLGYARKDQRSQPRDPVTTRYVAALFEAVGTDRVVTLDVHNLAAFQNAFRCRTEHLDTASLFARHFATSLAATESVVVVSPDPGGIKRAERLRRQLARTKGQEVPMAVLEKARAHGVLTPGRLVGEVAGRCAVVLDDLISTGGTLVHAAQTCRAQGATRVIAAAAHGLFVGNAAATLASEALDSIVVTDTVPPFRLPSGPVLKKLTVLSVTGLVAEAIRRMHAGGSITELLED
jgi:ribose-phosphate pyrophosphokinase